MGVSQQSTGRLIIAPPCGRLMSIRGSLFTFESAVDHMYSCDVCITIMSSADKKPENLVLTLQEYDSRKER